MIIKSMLVAEVKEAKQCKELKTPYTIQLITGKKAKVIYAVKTPYQLIEIVLIPTAVGQKRYLRALFLDGEVQYVEGKNKLVYHKAHAKILNKIPLSQVRNIAILGGGDGILAGIIADRVYPRKVYVLELDPCMIKAFSTHPLLRKDNYDAYHKRNVKVLIGDAYKNIDKVKNIDLVFVDLPDALTKERLELLYGHDRLGKIFKKAKFVSIYTGGVPPEEIEKIARLYGFRSLGRQLVYGWLGAIGYVVHFSKI